MATPVAVTPAVVTPTMVTITPAAVLSERRRCHRKQRERCQGDKSCLHDASPLVTRFNVFLCLAFQINRGNELNNHSWFPRPNRAVTAQNVSCAHSRANRQDI